MTMTQTEEALTWSDEKSGWTVTATAEGVSVAGVVPVRFRWVLDLACSASQWLLSPVGGFDIDFASAGH